jgi:ribonuclease HII
MSSLLPYFQENTLEAGIDEVGRGCLFGNVFISAVIMPADIEQPPIHINDSKKLSRNQREILRQYIEENAIDFAVVSLTPAEIDSHNILQATMKGMHKAIDELHIKPELLLVDGNHFNLYRDSEGNIIPHQTIIEGDGKYISIACASILAKTYHDEYINQLCEEHPELDEMYDLMNNMGYGTAKHIKGIETNGITEYHRKTFGICKEYAKRNDEL